MEEVRWGERPNAQAGEPCCRERRLQRGEDSCRAWRAHPDPQQLHHLWARCRHHLVVQEARQARVEARRRHHLCVLEVTCRRHRLCASLGEACKVVDLDEIPLEEEEGWTFEPERLCASLGEACEVVDLDEIPLKEEEEWTFEPERLQLSVEVRCPGPEGDHLANLEAKGISQGGCGATFG